MAKRTVLIMAGGTGGHVFPGLAVAERLRALGHEVHWLGTAERIEARVVPAAGFPLHTLSISGLRGRKWQKLVSMPWRISKAIVAAKKIMKRVKPDVVLGMGGFAAGPGGIAARWAGVPLVIHEQNAVMGLTNRLLSRFARTVLTAFETRKIPKAARRKVCQVGNPVRQGLRSRYKAVDFAKRPLNVLVFGGSLGAKTLNQAMPEVAATFAGEVHIWHQTGEKTYNETHEQYQKHHIEPFCLTPFIDDMAEAFSWADVVIARSGALTVSEIMQVGLPALLVPYPFAVDDHQYFNAQALAKAGAVTVIRDPNFNAQTCGEWLQAILAEPEKLHAMQQAMKPMARPAATEEVVKVCLSS